MPIPKDNITQTGPQDYKQIRKTLNNFFTVKERQAWVSRNAQLLADWDVSINKEGEFSNPDVEKAYKDTQFKAQFEKDPNYSSYADLSSEEKDRMLLEAKQRQFSQSHGLERVSPSGQVNEYGFPIQRKGQQQQDFTPRVDTVRTPTPAQLRAESEFNTGLTEGITEQEVQRKKTIAERYANDPYGYQRQKDIDALKEEAPILSQFYAEYVNNKNPYLNDEDIPWDALAPEIMTDLENGDITRASTMFNKELGSIMSKNQSGWEKFGRWNTRFFANLGLMAMDVVGLVEGPFEGLTKDIIIPAVTGQKIDWAQAGATTLYDNFLANLSYDWQEQLRENKPIYGIGGEDPLLDPESSAFMASMFLPTSIIGGIAKGSSLAGKTGRALKRAEQVNRLTGYNKNLRKAEKELGAALQEGSANSRRLTQMGQDAKMAALKEGKSVTEAQKEAKLVQQQALADIYQRGTIQRNQIRLSSILEGQVEAIGADQASQERFKDAWDKQVRALAVSALNGDIDLSETPYSLEEAESYVQELLEMNYLEAIVEQLKANPNASQYTDEQLREVAYRYLQEEAITRAKIDMYVRDSSEEFQAFANSQSNKAGMITLLENYVLLRFSEGLGGWTTRIPSYDRMASALSGQKNTLFGRAKNAVGRATDGVTSFGSNTSQLMSRVGFDATGRAVRKVTPKSVVQTIGKVGGTVGVETGQEVGQELFTSGAEGTSAFNAEEFVLSHLAGPGYEYTSNNYQSQLVSLFQHAGFGRDAEDFERIIKATALQMATGVPSVMKYRNRYTRYKGADNKHHTYDRMRRGTHESNLSYIWRNIESWVPMNSPVAQSITSIANTNTDVKTFIDTYNKLLDDSRVYNSFSSSSLNYASRAFNAATDADETAFEHSKFAAQTAEAIFLSQMRGKNKSKLIYYQNLADVNTKRENESDEAFQARRNNTLQQLRDESIANSITNLSDDELANWAETNGKTMLDMVNTMATKSTQLYEQHDGNITWEELYGTLYSDTLADYTQNRIKTIEDIYKGMLPQITNTEITDEERYDKEGKPIRIYNESELLQLNPSVRNNIVNSATGKQKTIVDSLLKQLETINTKEGLGRKIKEDFANAAKETQIIEQARNDLYSITQNPKAFLNRIRGRKLRNVAEGLFNELQDTFNDTELEETAKKEKISSIISRVNAIYDGSDMSYDAFVSLNRAIQTSFNSDQKDLYKQVENADHMNGIVLSNLVNDIIGKNKDESLLTQYRALEDKIQKSHIPFDEYKEVLNPEEQALLDTILARYKEAKDAAPVVELESNTDPTKRGAKDQEVKTEALPKATLEEWKTNIKSLIRGQLNELCGSLGYELTDTDFEALKLDEFLDKTSMDIDIETLKQNLLIHLGEIKTKLLEENPTKDLLPKIIKAFQNEFSKLDFGNIKNVNEYGLSLASPKFFLEEHPDGNFADFYRKNKIRQLLRSGKIKRGTKVYVLWDKAFVQSTEKSLTDNNVPMTLNKIGLVAVVEGAIDGYPSITVGDKTYTKIGLFRAYGNGTHNTKFLVPMLLESALGTVFEESKDFNTLKNSQELKSKDMILEKEGKPISFTISAINETALTPLQDGQMNNVKNLSEDRQGVIDEENKETENPEHTAIRAKEWFINSLSLRRTKKGHIMLCVSLPRHNKAGRADIPVFAMPITQTPFDDTRTIGDLLREQSMEVLAVPIFRKLANMLQYDKPELNTTIGDVSSKLVTLISDCINKKSTKEGQKTPEEKLNSYISSHISRYLHLPRNFSYRVEISQSTTNSSEYNIAIVAGTSNVGGEGISFNFLNLTGYKEGNGQIGISVIDNAQIVEGLHNLIYTPNNEVRMSSDGKTEFVKWQLDYGYNRNNGEEESDELGQLTEEGTQESNEPEYLDLDKASLRRTLDDLYDMGAIQSPTETFTTYEEEINIVPDSEIIRGTLDKKQITPKTPTKDDMDDAKNEPREERDVEKRAKALGLHLNNGKFIFRFINDLVEKHISSYSEDTWISGALNIKTKDDKIIPIETFILTNDNQLIAIYDSTNEAFQDIDVEEAIKGFLKDIGIDNTAITLKTLNDLKPKQKQEEPQTPSQPEAQQAEIEALNMLFSTLEADNGVEYFESEEKKQEMIPKILAFYGSTDRFTTEWGNGGFSEETLEDLLKCLK